MGVRADSIKEVNFICPECGENVLSAVLKVTEYVEISGFWKDPHPNVGSYSEIGETLDSYPDNHPFNFECHSCGFNIGETEQEVYKWLEEHGMLANEE